MARPSSFYLPSPDDLYKDLCRNLHSDSVAYTLSDQQHEWNKPKGAGGGGGGGATGAAAAAASSSLGTSTQSGTLHSWTTTTAGLTSRIIRLECSVGMDFQEWYESVVVSCCGEQLVPGGENVCYIVFETSEDAGLVYDYLTTVASNDFVKITLVPFIPHAEDHGGLCRHPECDEDALSRQTIESSPGAYHHFIQSAFDFSDPTVVPAPPRLFVSVCGPLRPQAASPSALLASSTVSSSVSSAAAGVEDAGGGVPAPSAARKGKVVHLAMSYNTCMDSVIEQMSVYGKIRKIIIFTKDTTVQSLMEFEDAQSAANAVRKCKTEGMTVQFSRLKELHIQQNNNRAWDFTVDPVRKKAGGEGPSSPLALVSIGFNEILSMKKLPKDIKDWLKNETGGGGLASFAPGLLSNVLIVYNVSCESVDEIFNVFSIYGICLRVKILTQKDACALVQFSDPVFSSFAKFFLSRTFLWKSPGLQIAYSKIDHLKKIAAPDDHLFTKTYTQADQRFCEVYKYANCVTFPSETIFIASISDRTPKAHLYKLFSSIGKVVAHEIRTPYPDGPKKTHMLVQYAHTHTAIKAIAKLHNSIIDGSQIKIAFSKVELKR